MKCAFRGILSLFDSKSYQKTYCKIYYKSHREQIRANAARSKRRRLGKKFGVEYLETAKCHICLKEISGRDRHLDHNDLTEEFRGWLCRKCNLTVGLLETLSVPLNNYLKYIGVE